MSEFRLADERFIRECLRISLRGEGKVEPGPLVGAILVRGGKVIKSAFYSCYGGPHAEQKLLAGGSSCRGATMYVSLEPCVSFAGKRTPSCARLIADSGIRRVVVAMRDPFRHVSGRGVALLRRRGIKVVEGVCNQDARLLNRAYIKRVTTGMPYVIAKWAMTLDGNIATRAGDSKWITSEDARLHAKRLRADCSAVAVGIGTILKDDPRLMETARIIFDSRARIPANSRVIKTCRRVKTFVVVSKRAPRAKRARLARFGANVVVFDRLTVRNVLRYFGSEGYSRIMIEGGGRLLGSAFEEGMIDEVYAYVAGKLAGGGKSPLDCAGVRLMSNALKLATLDVKRVGRDVLIHTFVAR